MLNISQLKKQASDAMGGKWTHFAVVSLVYVLIYYALILLVFAAVIAMDGGEYKDGSPLYNVASIAINLLVLPLIWSLEVIFLRNMRGAADVKISNLFDGYGDYLRITLTLLLRYLYTVFWMLLLIIPGIVKNYSYAMTSYVLQDCPDLKYNRAIERSMKLMKGNKMRLFLLDLSFIGWGLLGVLTLFIGFLWITPYWMSARAAFYQDLLAEEAKVDIAESLPADSDTAV